MREIKFRVWDGEKMVYDWFAIERTTIGTLVPFQRSTVAREIMQFTGLLDRNGKEIYEGDILTGFYPDFGVVKFGTHETSTDECNDRAYGWFIETPSKYTYSIIIQNDMEVIGNVFENPELLK